MNDSETDLTAEMGRTVDAFFRDVTPAEFADFLSEIRYDHYRHVHEHVLSEQPGDETLVVQSMHQVGQCFVREFRELDEPSEVPADHEDLALAA